MDKSLGASREKLLLGSILLLALLHGAFYIFLEPPWQHYDEPNHFEHVWLAANLDHLPSEKDYSAKLSRMVVKSMLENGFFEHQPTTPTIGPPTEKIRIPGYSQLSEPPLYYLLASIPLKLIPSESVDAQLYAARLVSIIFLLITVFAAWGIAGELVPPGHPLRWMLPITIALFPAFVDLMSAVNNDAAAIGISSLLLWMSVRLIRRSFAWVNLVIFVVLAVLAYFVKITALLILSLVPFIFIFTFVRGRFRKFAWGSLFFAFFLTIALSMRWDDAFAWYRNTSQAGSTRLSDSQAPLGENVFTIQDGSPVSPPGYPEVFQHFPYLDGKILAGKPATFGYWIWSDRSQLVSSPFLKISSQPFSEKLLVSPTPIFFAFHYTIPQDAGRFWIYLSPEAEVPGSMVYYDGFILLEGIWPTDQAPVFSSTSGEAGEWAGKPFTNIIRNPSAETPGLRFSPWLDDLAVRFLPDGARPSLLISSLLDTWGTQDLYPATAVHIFQTFWARFGWGNLSVVGDPTTYQVLGVVSLLGLIGAILHTVRKPRSIAWDVVFVFGLFGGLLFVMALTRGGVYLAVPGFYFSVARYLYPAIIPLIFFFVCGWLELFQRVLVLTRGRSSMDEKPTTIENANLFVESGSGIFFVLYVGFFLLLDVFSIFSIFRYFYYS